ncbi:MAG: hypothetical protein A2Y38_08520 [Spirochaetes bacterium GWB1_59_5]|nr:MAG: hypothetical protein A2Y38_08520 [Spirochaetes bacterium GWB1_59_5]
MIKSNDVVILLEEPGYWLGQVAAICRLQKANKLSVEDAFAQVNETLADMRSVDQRTFVERRILARIAAKAEASGKS